jgi:protoporphyrinogen IX oxidase
MEILVNIILWVHLVALVGAGASAVAMPVIGGRMGSASPETRTVLFGIVRRISTSARGALVLLLITGPLLFWLRWDFTAPSMVWFAIKMVLVLVILVCVIVAGINGSKAQSGDTNAARTAAVAGRIMGAALLGVIFAAVFAFN